MKKFRKILSYFCWFIFALLVVNVILYFGFGVDLCLFTMQPLAWFEPSSHQWVAYLILIGGILSVIPAMLVYPEEEDPVPDNQAVVT
ncbi:MAG: hypothetical protein WCN88_04280 [Candidatus Falkowbacteria bacterium]